GREEMNILAVRLVVELPQRLDVVKNPEGAPVRGDDQVVVVHCEVVDGSLREIHLQRLPVRAVVVRDEDAGFGSRVKKAAVLWVLADHVNVRGVGNSIRQLRPLLAVTGGPVDVRTEIVQAMAVDSDISGPGVM